MCVREQPAHGRVLQERDVGRHRIIDGPSRNGELRIEELRRAELLGRGLLGEDEADLAAIGTGSAIGSVMHLQVKRAARR